MPHLPRMLTCLGLLGPMLASASAQEAPPATVPEAVKGITANELGGHMRFLASDLMKGRDTASPETRLAAEYLASRLFAAGAEPLGEPGPRGRTYFQSFPLEVVTPLEEGTSLTLVLELNGSKRVVPCKLGDDFVLFPRGITPGEVEAQVVFAGYGRVDANQKIDDYEGLDVKNKFVLVYAGQPDGPNERGNGRVRATPMFNPFAKAEPARRNGALGVLVIQPPGKESAAPRAPFTARNLGFGRSSMTLGPAATSIPALNLNDPIRDLLVGAVELAADSKPRALDGVKARFSFAATKETKGDRNVLGIFPGSDPEKRNEIVIFSAHYDHEGVNSQGEIMNGSDDNASGTSTLLELAEAFGEGPRPARSVAFLWVSGEEKGLLGSKWFADHMTLSPDQKIVADINLDMVSRNDSKKVGITPSPKLPDYNTLVPAAQAACQAEGLEAMFDSDSYFYRTDSASFAQKGIPVIFFFAGEHVDYHKPTDDVEKADFEKAARIGRAAYRLGWQMAQAPEAPKKIKPGDAPQGGRSGPGQPELS